MPHIFVTPPPGIVRPGTVYQTKGRWFDMNHVRWYGGNLQAVGGWSVLSGAGSSAVAGPVRGMKAWRTNNGDVRIFIGTNDAAFVHNGGGTLTDVTPASGFSTAGLVDATGGEFNRTEANSWQIDTFGEDLVAVDFHNEKLWTYDATVVTNKLTQVTAPTDVPTTLKAIVVTPERFVVALHVNGDPRLVQWSDQEDFQSTGSWTPTAQNQAGDFRLEGQGAVMAGRRGRRETLIWTEEDLYAMRFIGGPLVYSFQIVGNNCGPISRRSMAIVDGRAIWMGQHGFFLYDGSVRPIPSPVDRFVFESFDGVNGRQQASKVAVVVRSDFKEIRWFYPSANLENDRYVVWNYADNFWMIGEMDRTDGVDRGALDFPLNADSNGAVYQVEQGITVIHDDEGGSPSFTPFIETGVIELGKGDQVLMIRQIITDEISAGGGVQAIIKSSFYPEPAGGVNENVSSAFPLTSAPQSVRITARQARLRLEQVANGWRVGDMRFEVVTVGLR